jgi:hypothetical protein
MGIVSVASGEITVGSCPIVTFAILSHQK